MGEAVLSEGMIVKGVGGFYEVWLPETGELVTCKARGVFRREGLVPLAGDRVRIEAKPAVPGQGFLSEMEPRRNVFVRPPVANMDRMAIIVSAGTPAPDLPLVDKLLLACALRGIRPLLVVNKIDQAEPGRVEALQQTYAGCGCPVLALSCRTGEGVPALLEALAGAMTVLAGQSGVGKSTLLNALLETERMQTGELSEKIQRGRHTTRHAELLPMPGHGWICDTPGFSQFELDAVPYAELDALYPEFEPERLSCRFPGCSHLREPDCAIRAKVEAGDVSASRFDNYARFYVDLRELHHNRYR